MRVRRRSLLKWSGLAVTGLLVVVAGSNAWLWLVSSGHRSEPAQAPIAPVVIVPGAKVAADGTPMSYLRGRLDVAIDLVRAGKATGILVSGDAGGVSGDEIASMTQYLVAQGIDPGLIRADPAGLSTRETCERAHQRFGIERALIVTQYEHLPRAVALCRAAGIDADGVTAYCECRRITVVRNNLREWLAAPKAIFALIFRSP
ncbi:ElyC/SanA/YdcF family protein [Nocardia sp. NPDC051832]|uniref:SanA/YdcF family protein n=1 Tax=Nocardia sp. NPDC051832 TaxID=3155673 RepID=UPI003428C288